MCLVCGENQQAGELYHVILLAEDGKFWVSNGVLMDKSGTHQAMACKSLNLFTFHPVTPATENE